MHYPWFACCKTSLPVYCLSMDALTFIYSYMKRKKQGVKINVTESLFKILLSGVPQGSILGPILLHIFTNNLLFLINESKRANITHDNTIYTSKRELKNYQDC